MTGQGWEDEAERFVAWANVRRRVTNLLMGRAPKAGVRL